MKTTSLRAIMGMLFLFVFVFAAVVTVTTNSAFAGSDPCCYDPGNGYGFWVNLGGGQGYCQCSPNHPVECEGAECRCFFFCLV